MWNPLKLLLLGMTLAAVSAAGAYAQERLPVPPVIEDQPMTPAEMAGEPPAEPGDSLPPASLPDALPTFGESSPGIGVDSGASPSGLRRPPTNIEELMQQNPGLFDGSSFSGGNLFQKEIEGAPLEEQEATVQKALVDLQSQDPEIRRSACMILGKYGLPQARAGLFTALRDSVAVVRRTALVALLENRPQLTGREALDVLPMIGDEDVHNRRLASSSTQMMLLTVPFQNRPGNHMPVRAFPADIAAKLKAALTDSDLTVRRNMVSSLVNLRLELDDDTLKKLLADSDREIRLGALTAMSQLRPSSIITLGPMLVDDPEPLVREELVKQLARLRNPSSHDLLAKLADDKELKVSVFAKLSLLDLDPNVEAFRKLLPVLNEPGVGSDIIRPLIYSAPMLPAADALEVTKEILKTRSAVYSADALNVYSTLVVSAAKPDLAPVLPYVEDGIPAIRQAALGVLMRAPRALSEADILKLTSSEHADVRQQTVYLARLLPADKANDLAMEMLLDENVDVRVAALRELASRSAPNWQNLVAQSLQDDDANMSQAALEIISMTPSAANLKVLEEFIAKNPQHALHQSAMMQLEQMRRQFASGVPAAQTN